MLTAGKPVVHAYHGLRANLWYSCTTVFIYEILMKFNRWYSCTTGTIVCPVSFPSAVWRNSRDHGSYTRFMWFSRASHQGRKGPCMFCAPALCAYVIAGVNPFPHPRAYAFWILRVRVKVQMMVKVGPH